MARLFSQCSKRGSTVVGSAADHTLVQLWFVLCALSIWYLHILCEATPVRGRVGAATREATLAGSGQDDEEAAALQRLPFVAPDRDGAAAAHFVAECFFLTQRAMHNLLMPAGAAFPSQN